MKKYFVFILLLLVAGCSSNNDSVAQSDEFEFRDAATGLDTPWEITWGPDGWIWMTERYGRISRVNPESGRGN
jgi:glucose/arabinose dehydrogenase